MVDFITVLVIGQTVLQINPTSVLNFINNVATNILIVQIFLIQNTPDKKLNDIPIFGHITNNDGLISIKIWCYIKYNTEFTKLSFHTKYISKYLNEILVEGISINTAKLIIVTTNYS